MDVVTNARESLSQELNKWFWTSQRTEWDQKRSKLVKQMALQIETISEHQPAPNQLALQSTHAMLGSEAEKLAGLKRDRWLLACCIPPSLLVAVYGRSGRASLDEKLQQYADVVEYIVEPSSQLERVPVTDLLRRIGRQRNEENSTELNCGVARCWDIAHEILSCATDANLPELERRVKMATAAAQYLGRQFKELVVLPCVRPGSGLDEYESVALKMRAERGQAGEQDPWQQLYLRFRCWELDGALQYAKQYLNDQGFIQALEGWIRREPAPSTLPDMGRDTNSYRKVMFSIVRQGDSQSFEPDVIEHSEDFIWYRMAHLYPKTEKASFSQELHALQSDVVSWGHESFSSYPLVYLQVLLLTQQFEQAVAYWWDPKAPADSGDTGTVDRTRGVEAIHLALALMDARKKGAAELLHVKPSTVPMPYFCCCHCSVVPNSCVGAGGSRILRLACGVW